MNMKMYYVAEISEGFYDEHDLDYVVGPFTRKGAYKFKNLQDRSWIYEVVEQVVDVLRN